MMEVFGSHLKHIVWIQCRLHLLPCKFCKAAAHSISSTNMPYAFKIQIRMCIYLESNQIASHKPLWGSKLVHMHSQIRSTFICLSLFVQVWESFKNVERVPFLICCKSNEFARYFQHMPTKMIPPTIAKMESVKDNIKISLCVVL